MRDLERIKKMYSSYSRIFDILESGDIFDERYKLLLKSLTIEEVEAMRTFMQVCQDRGIHLLVKKEVN
jgi:hypothetical protein